MLIFWGCIVNDEIKKTPLECGPGMAHCHQTSMRISMQLGSWKMASGLLSLATWKSHWKKKHGFRIPCLQVLPWKLYQIMDLHSYVQLSFKPALGQLKIMSCFFRFVPKEMACPLDFSSLRFDWTTLLEEIVIWSAHILVGIPPFGSCLLETNPCWSWFLGALILNKLVKHNFFWLEFLQRNYEAIGALSMDSSEQVGPHFGGLFGTVAKEWAGFWCLADMLLKTEKDLKRWKRFG